MAEKGGDGILRVSWREEEIQSRLEQDVVGPPDPVKLDALRLQLRRVLTHGQTPTRKAVMRALTHRVTVEDRKQVYPTFRLSVDAVRIVDGLAVPPWHCAHTLALVEGTPIVLTPPNTVLRTGDGDR